MKIVDTRGERCPKPIIETRKALKECASGEVFKVLTDNRTSYNNVSRFLTDNKVIFSVTEENGVWAFTINSDTGKTDYPPAEDYCETSTAGAPGNYAVAITSERMGEGDPELGSKLMKSFFVALSVMDEMPRAIVFYNSGVKLAAAGSEVADLLREIEQKGVELILCGTCVDHFGLDGKLSSGKIGDMYLILTRLAAASKVIRP